MRLKLNLNSQVGVGVSNVFEQGVVFLAHEGFAVVACHIVPMDAVVVEVVEDRYAVLGGATLVQFLWMKEKNQI